MRRTVQVGWTALAQAVLLLSSFATPSRSAEVQPTYAEHRLCKVTLQPGESISVLSANFDPVDVVQGAAIAVFVGPPGKYAVIIDRPDGPDQIRVTRITSGGPAPDPDPPDPPDPVPPAPDDVSDIMGVGKIAYSQAVATGDKAGAAKLAAVFRDCESRMHQGSLLPVDAQKIVEAQIGSLGGLWPAWLEATMKAVDASIDKHGAGIVPQKNIWREIRLALEAFK